jgi:hypothetical protein
MSPEEQKDESQILALDDMRICMNIDEFFDIVFHVDNSYIKAHSLILKSRSQYFAAMLNKHNNFSEVAQPPMVYENSNKYQLIKITGVPKVYLNCII